MNKKMVVLIAVFFALSSSLYAQSISIGPQAAYLKSSDAEKGVLMPAGAVRLDLGGLAVEGSIGYKAEEFYDGLIETTSYPIMLTALLKILPIVHVEAGIGFYNTDIKIKGTPTITTTQKETGYHAGGGAEIVFGNIVLTADFRYVKMGELKDLKITKDLKSDFIAIIAGLMFRL